MEWVARTGMMTSSARTTACPFTRKQRKRDFGARTPLGIKVAVGRLGRSVVPSRRL